MRVEIRLEEIDDRIEPVRSFAEANIGIAEFLDEDTRPTFVIDLEAPQDDQKAVLTLVFCNKSLRFFDELRAVITAETFFPSAYGPSATPAQDALTQAELDFKEWCFTLPSARGPNEGYLQRHLYRELVWTCCTLRQRWKVISASQAPHQVRGASRLSGTTSSRSRSTSASTIRSSESGRSDIDISTVDADLSKQLADSESKFKVLTELNPVGIYYLSPEGDLKYANDMWYEITGHPRGLEGEMSFM